METGIDRALARYPRETLTRTPTPFDRLPHAGARLSLDLYLKRDDLTDLALGGDKSRKLEYEVAKAGRPVRRSWSPTAARRATTRV